MRRGRLDRGWERGGKNRSAVKGESQRENGQEADRIKCRWRRQVKGGGNVRG